jgi:hypothetical protein
MPGVSSTMLDHEQPPLVMAYWLLLVVYLAEIASDAVAADVGAEV